MKNDRKLLKYRGTICLNCNQPLDKSEAYCHNCGQLNSSKRLTFNDFFYEYFAGTLAYDSKTIHTFKLLLFSPGKISKDYIEGKRVRYANPYKFYLSVSLIFFILWGLTGSFENNPEITYPEGPGIAVAFSTAADSISNAEYLDEILFPENKGKTLEDIYLPEAELDTLAFWPGFKKKWNIFSKKYVQSKITNPEIALHQLNYSLTSYNKWLYKKIVDFNYFINNPNLFFDYFIGKLPYIIFFYLPIFTLFIWLLYVRKPYTYMEHLIFTFHTQSLWFVLYGLGLLLELLFSSSIFTNYVYLVFLFYLFFALKTFYSQGWVKTFIKFVALNVIFITLAGVATVISMLATFAVY